jgi:type VI secretion system secreted protein VgrG
VAVIHLSSNVLPDDASVRRFDAVEAVSRPYRVSVEFATSDPGFEVTACLRQRALATLVGADGRQRLFDGIVERGRYVGHTGTQSHFRIEIVPLLALLAHREDCRIFQDMTAVEVVEQVLADAGIDERVDWRLEQEVGKRDFVVQYRETDLSFLERLLEDEGIFYFFEHGAEGHTLVLSDHPGAFAPQREIEPVHFGLVQGLAEVTDPISLFARELRITPNEVLLRDFDAITPQVKPEGAASAEGAWPLVVYEYPAGLRTADGQAARRAQARLKELRASADTCVGQSAAIGLCPGVPFEVSGAAEPCNNGEFVVTELSTHGEQAPDGEAQNISAENRFTAIPAGAPFAAPRRASRPRIRGIQTGIVTGPSNEQQAIHTDEYGRVKVRFHWDRAGIGDDKSSAWLRVVQLGLGASMIIPRVGWEVAIGFENGDPDRPLVLGRLYNGKQRPMIDLPGNATCGAFKSLSSPGGAGSNTLGTDDAGGGQGMSLGGPKDMNSFVGADKNETVAVNEKHSVTGNLSSTVAGAETWNVGGNQAINVGDALQVKTGPQTITVGGNETIGSAANYIEAVGARAYTIAGNRITISNGVRTLVSGAMTRNVGSVQVVLSAGTIKDSLANYIEDVGAVKAELVLGDSAENVAGDKTLSNSVAELHMVTDYNTEAATVNRLIGGVHLTSAGGDYEVSAPQIALVGGVGHFTGGGSSLKLNGGPIVAKGPTIKIETALARFTAASLKLT